MNITKTRVGVYGVIIKDNKIALVKKKNGGYKGKYDLPGGGMKFHEDTYLLMEKYLFDFINVECDLLINMYEEEWIDGENLSKTLEITGRMISNCDNKEFHELHLHRLP